MSDNLDTYPPAPDAATRERMAAAYSASCPCRSSAVVHALCKAILDGWSVFIEEPSGNRALKATREAMIQLAKARL